MEKFVVSRNNERNNVSFFEIIAISDIIWYFNFWN